jgi:transcriptional regulator with XRE-family HTH domain/tetratricopeptide (TPR) repeat protein
MRPGLPLAAHVRSLRIAAHLTLDALAEHSGISARTISDIERGVSTSPQSRTVLALTDALGLDSAARDGLLRAARARPRSKAVDENRSTAVAPHRTADFSGRNRELSAMLAMLGDSDDETAQVVLVSGPAGIGKTTIALELAARADAPPSRTLFVDLGGFSSEPLTPLEVLRALLRQVPRNGEGAPITLDDAVRRWKLETKASGYLVLLDNAAHESQVRPVLTLDSRSQVVVTSRRSLAGLEGVRRVTLGPLTEEEAILMLSRLVPESQRASNDLGELAGLCDHIPLALRIAGHRIASRPTSSTRDFLVRMRAAEDRLRLLVAGDLAVEAAFALSYDELDSSTAALFRSISVIDGPTFDARVAAAINDTNVLDIEERLDELTDLGLVEARGGNRYRVHDLLRLFGAARHKRDVGQRGVADAHRRLRFWLLNSLERGGSWFEPERSPEIPGADGIAFPNSITAEAWIRLEEPHWWPALQEASRNGEHSIVVEVADALHWFSELWTEWGHWQHFFKLAVVSARALGEPRLEAMHLRYLAWAQVHESHDRELPLQTALLAIKAADRSGDAQQRGWANSYAAWTHHLLGRDDEATEHSRLAIDQFGSAYDLDGAAHTQWTLTSATNDSRDPARALKSLEAVLERTDRDDREKYALVANLTRLVVYEYMARGYTSLGHHQKAIAVATLCVELAGQFASPIRSAGALRHRITANIAAGNTVAAQIDIDAGLVGLEAVPSDSSYLRLRNQLLALRAGLASASQRQTRNSARPL